MSQVMPWRQDPAFVWGGTALCIMLYVRDPWYSSKAVDAHLGGTRIGAVTSHGALTRLMISGLAGVCVTLRNK